MSGHHKWEDIKKMRSVRPRKCRECHAEATHVELQDRRYVVIAANGDKREGIEIVAVYWCDQHTGVK